jgi:CBS domain-containing protein
MQPLYVSDAMNASVVTISEEAPLRDALSLMQQHKISGLVVVDHAGYMVGIISQTDLLRAWQEAPDFTAIQNSPVSHYMTREVISCAPHKPLDYAMQLLDQHQIRRLVVVETHTGGRFVTDRVKPVGILSQTDIVRALIGKVGDAGAEETAATNTAEA